MKLKLLVVGGLILLLGVLGVMGAATGRGLRLRRC